MVINHAKSLDAVLNMERFNIVTNVNKIRAKNINIWMNMIFLLRAGGERQI